MEDVSCDENDDPSDLDPRIQIELEKLNTATDKINSLEVEIDEANTTFRLLLNESIRRLKVLSKRLGGCIERARPYYDALEVAKKAQLECQRAAVQYQRASEIHQAAKETVALAEERFLSKQHEWQFDNAWQEMLNHATMKVMEAESAKTENGLEHQRRAVLFNKAEQKVQALEAKLRRSVNKSRPYFEEKELCLQQLSTQKERVDVLQQQVTAVKQSYAASLKQLELISEEIHRKRGVREPGVGAEHQDDPEMYQETCAKYHTAEPRVVPAKYARITALPDTELLPDTRACSSNYSDLDYELELDRCDLQSLGSASMATSSAVSDEECLEDDSEMEELKQMAATRVEGMQLRRTPSDTRENVRRLSENWERQMSETINKLGSILSLKQKETSTTTCCAETKEKY